ncbi:TPA: GFA family protein [Pseudomonas aeruginosa]|uniref:GFA family protein n=1 Tax=Pseudomonas aeruginosa TaxID=287 RepID=UPI002552E724|nr:GFA family protein [Pseudomonas aeruginosa]HBO1619933.1 GFA family protein [Pseudomonas aeruginosa]HBO9387502.1 GFA family protein [Pseudomonas aeruginosa]
MKYPITGSCQCGNVTYKLSKPPIAVAACHCKQCQQLSTSAFSITAMIEPDSINISGEMNEYSRVAASGNISSAKFCPTCTNHIYHYNPSNPQHLMLKPSTLSDTSIIKPTIHVWTSEKQDWFEIPQGVLAFDTQP